MDPILTVTLNPAIDVSAEVPVVTAGPKLRCLNQRLDPGGGGVNVSRAISRLGGTSTAFVALGGVTGTLLREMLEAEGIAVVAFETGGLTRQSFAVIETETARQFRFVMPGPDWRSDDRSRMLGAIADATERGAFVVLSGTLPPGLPVDTLDALKRTTVERGAKLVLDTSGPALRHAETHSEGGPCHILRMDGEEAEDLAGTRFDTPQALAAFGRTLIEDGVAEHLVMALGSYGTAGVGPSDAFFCRAPSIETVSAVGAGDSLVGALVLALAEGRDFREAVRAGTAAAGAAVMTPATELCDGAIARDLVGRVAIEDLPL